VPKKCCIGVLVCRCIRDTFEKTMAVIFYAVVCRQYRMRDTRKHGAKQRKYDYPRRSPAYHTLSPHSAAYCGIAMFYLPRRQARRIHNGKLIAQLINAYKNPYRATSREQLLEVRQSANTTDLNFKDMTISSILVKLMVKPKVRQTPKKIINAVFI